MSEHVECPACGKKAVVQRQDNVYQCLNCDFKKDFSEPPTSNESDKSENPVFWLSVIVSIVALLLVQARYSSANNANPEVQSSQVSITAPSTMD
jgi:hypothetical protein